MILPYDANPGRMEFSERTAVALAPRIINTVENPNTKQRLNPTVCIRNGAIVAPDRVAIERPAIKPIYPGTSGKTHGDKKEIAPAANTATKPMFESSITCLQHHIVDRPHRPFRASRIIAHLF
jgi:hypothetical protein